MRDILQEQVCYDRADGGSRSARSMQREGIVVQKPTVPKHFFLLTPKLFALFCFYKYVWLKNKE